MDDPSKQKRESFFRVVVSTRLDSREELARKKLKKAENFGFNTKKMSKNEERGRESVDGEGAAGRCCGCCCFPGADARGGGPFGCLTLMFGVVFVGGEAFCFF